MCFVFSFNIQTSSVSMHSTLYIPNCNRYRVYCFRSRYYRFFQISIFITVYLYTTITQCIIIIQVRCINSNIFSIYIYEFSIIILISHLFVLYVIMRNFRNIFCSCFSSKKSNKLFAKLSYIEKLVKFMTFYNQPLFFLNSSQTKKPNL